MRNGSGEGFRLGRERQRVPWAQGSRETPSDVLLLTWFFGHQRKPGLARGHFMIWSHFEQPRL